MIILPIFEKPTQYSFANSDHIKKTVKKYTKRDLILINKFDSQKFHMKNGIDFVDNEHADYYHIHNSLHLIDDSKNSPMYNLVLKDMGFTDPKELKKTIRYETIIYPIIKAITRTAMYFDKEETYHYVLDLETAEDIIKLFK